MENTLLVINRISTLRRQTLMVLRDMGYSPIEQANNVEVARKILQNNNSISIILLELTASGAFIEEFEFLKDISKNPVTKHIRVIISSPIVERDTVKKAVAVGIYKIIIKLNSLELFSKELKKALDSLLKK